jgi:hypothetical protein
MNMVIAALLYSPKIFFSTLDGNPTPGQEPLSVGDSLVVAHGFPKVDSGIGV